MLYATYLRLLLTTLRVWWQQHLEEIDKAAPYPLVQEEWDLIQQQEAARHQQGKAGASATSYVDRSGLLVDLCVGESVG